MNQFQIIEIKVIPNSGKYKIIQDKTNVIKCYVKNVAEKGKANKEVIELISEYLDISKNNIEIIGGLTGSRKKIKIYTSLTMSDLMLKLGFKIPKY